MLQLLKDLVSVFIIPELRKKFFFTLGVLGFYRLGAHVPLVGLNTLVLRDIMSKVGGAGTFVSFFDFFSGGALRQVAIFSLGVQPYISASICMQVLTYIEPTFQALSKEGDYGRRIIETYTRYLALGLSFLQAIALIIGVERYPGLVVTPGWMFRITGVILIMTGALVVMWLGEQISQYGLGQGSTMIIFSGIASAIPGGVYKMVTGLKAGDFTFESAAFVLAFCLILFFTIIYLEKGERRILVQYPRRIVGQKIYSGGQSYLPLKLNGAGIAPVIFAQQLLMWPLILFRWIFTKLGWAASVKFFDYNSPLYLSLMVVFIFVCSYGYTFAFLNPEDLANQMKKSGSFVSGKRPGRRTAEFFHYILLRIGIPGAFYLAVVAVMPNVVFQLFSSPVVFTGTSLLICVGVGLDFAGLIHSSLIDNSYSKSIWGGSVRM